MNELQAAITSFSGAFEPVLEGLMTPCPDFMQVPLAYVCLGGGKRLRPFLTYQVGGGYKASPAVLLRVGAALEFIHAYSLIHDDLPVMDNGSMRRGKPSAHRAFGEARALLLGDGLLTRAFEVIAQEKTLSPETRIELIRELGRASGMEGMVAGQWLDITEETLPLTQEQLIKRHQLKTGALMACSCRFGALVGGASQEVQELWERFGLIVGLAFQVADDVLDASGKSQNLGKEVGQDSQKTTFVTLLGLEAAQAYAACCVEEAQGLLRTIPVNNEQNINTLHRLADYIITRTT